MSKWNDRAQTLAMFVQSDYSRHNSDCVTVVKSTRLLQCKRIHQCTYEWNEFVTDALYVLVNIKEHIRPATQRHAYNGISYNNNNKDTQVSRPIQLLDGSSDRGMCDECNLAFTSDSRSQNLLRCTPLSKFVPSDIMIMNVTVLGLQIINFQSQYQDSPPDFSIAAVQITYV